MLKYKKLNENAKDLVRAKQNDAGVDLALCQQETIYPNKVTMCSTGIAVELPPGTVGFLIPRSSTHKLNVKLANTVGVIDSSFRGVVQLPLTQIHESDEVVVLEQGMRIAQLVVVPCDISNFVLVDELSPSDRGEGGFGSTGK